MVTEVTNPPNTIQCLQRKLRAIPEAAPQACAADGATNSLVAAGYATPICRLATLNQSCLHPGCHSATLLRKRLSSSFGTAERFATLEVLCRMFVAALVIPLAVAISQTQGPEARAHLPKRTLFKAGGCCSNVAR